MNNIERTEKEFIFFSALCDVVKLFGDMELGSCEVDISAVATYCKDFKFQTDLFEYNTKEEIYEKITNDILDGFPVWEFLEVSDWTKSMLEKSYLNKQKKKYDLLCKKYACMTCQYYNAEDTSIGVFEKCTLKESVMGRRDLRLKRTSSFRKKKSCKNYIKEEFK